MTWTPPRGMNVEQRSVLAGEPVHQAWTINREEHPQELPRFLVQGKTGV